MKQLLSIFSVLMIFSSMSLTVFAGGKTFEGNGNGNVGIVADYIGPSDNKGNVTKVYAVTIEWQQTGDLVYNAGNTVYSWNEQELAYDKKVTNKGWSGTATVDITAKNRSNSAVKVKGEPFKNSSNCKCLKVTGSYDKPEIELPSAASSDYDKIGKVQVGMLQYHVTHVEGEWNGKGVLGTLTLVVTGK